MKRGDAFLWKEGTSTKFGAILAVDHPRNVAIVSVQGRPFAPLAVPLPFVEGMIMNLLLLEAESTL